MQTQLATTAGEFLRIADRELARVREALETKSKIRPILRRVELIRHVVDRLGETDQFQSLVASVRQAAEDSSKDWNSHALAGIGDLVATFLKNSGIYLRIAAGEDLSAKEFANSILSAVTEELTHTVHYFAPLGFTHLNSALLKGPGFEIRDFNIADLEQLVNPERIRTFYPHAVVELSDLANHSILHCASETSSPPPLSRDLFSEFFAKAPGLALDRVSTLPAPLKKPLRLIALLSWMPNSDLRHDRPEFLKGESPHWPAIPYWIERDESLFSIPESPADWVDMIGDFIDEPSPQIIGHWIETAEQEVLQGALEAISGQLEVIESVGTPWRFVQTSADFLVQAMLSSGIESFLWGHVAIEALLGERNPPGGLANSIRRRLVNLLETSPKGQKDLGKSFIDLYDLRSRLLHGDHPADEPLEDDIFLDNKPMSLAQAACNQMIRILGDVAPTFQDSSKVPPAKSEILRLIDSQNCRDIRDFLNALPEHSPLLRES